MKNLGKSRCESCIIRHLNSFKALNKEELIKISSIKEIKSFKKGEVIFGEGKRLKGVYCIKSGNPKLSKMSDNGKNHIVKIASRGDLLGQRSLISESPSNLSAVALNDMEVCFVPKDHIIDLTENKSFIKEVLVNMTNELKIANDNIVEMAQKKVNQRTAKALLYLEENFGFDAEGYLILVLSREDFSNVVGAAKEAFIRTLSEFKKNKLISLSGKKIKILDKEKLQQIASFS